MNSYNGREIELPAGVLQPTGKRITCVIVRGVGPILVDEIYEVFCSRLRTFMNTEHERGDTFPFTTFYSWQVEVNKLHQRHIKTEPSCFTVDGCADITQITPEYITVDPIELKQPSPIAQAPFAMHGPGKRR